MHVKLIREEFLSTFPVTVKDSTPPMHVVVSGRPEKATCRNTYVVKGHHDVLLKWEVVTPGWEIIAITGLPGNVFKHSESNGTGGWQCQDTNREKEPTDYVYTGKVRKIGTDVEVDLDPTVRNGGGGQQ